MQAKIRAKIIFRLSQLYGTNEEWSKGEALLDQALDVPDLQDLLAIRLAAAKFYSLCADKGPDGFFAGWNKRRYREKLDLNLDIVEKLCEKENIRSMSLFPILDIYKRYSMKDRAEKLILSQLLKNPLDLQSFIMLAKVYEDNENYADEFRVWKIIIDSSRYPDIKRIWENFFSAIRGNSNLYYQLGYSALRSGNWKEAVAAFDWGLLKKPNDPIGLFQLGFAYLKMGKYKKAVYKFEKVAGLPDAKYFMAHCYRRLGEYKKAFTAMEEAESMAKKMKENKFLSEDFYMEFAYIADKSKELEKAESILQALLKDDPDNPMLNNFLGYLWADHNINLDQAEMMIQKALDEEEDNYAYLDSMAWIFYRKKDYKKALEYIEESLENCEDPIPDAVISEHAGDIHAALGNKNEALKYWELAIETFSDDINEPKIREKIKDLK